MARKRPGKLRQGAAQGPGSLRIIGGEWRGRRLDVLDSPGLRPTPDRVRETLFNWLQIDVPGARCLDLFAGTGALGLEALSRGAGQLVFVEREAAVAKRLEANIGVLKADSRTSVISRDALAWLKGEAGPFDLVFLDPPYHQGLLQPAIDVLLGDGLIDDAGAIYFEHASDEPEPEWPQGWQVERRKKAGQVVYGLCRCCSAV